MPKHPTPPRRVLVVTGSRSEFGLLRSVMDAVEKQKGLTLQVAVAGEHLLGPAFTWREVARAYRIDAKVPMQKPGDKGRAAHAAACGRGVEGFAKAIKKLKPDWVVVLGDRIEAFAAASAASIAGVAVCHIHGGDRAEGIADEAMRHAITKLAHLHCAATKLSAERIVKMGEPEGLVHVTGSPAIDGLSGVKPMTRRQAGELHDVGTILLLHPSGIGEAQEARFAGAVLHAIDEKAPGDVLLLAPNRDPGWQVIDSACRLRARTPERRVWYDQRGFVALKRDRDILESGRRWFFRSHLPRDQFVGLLKRMAASHDCLLIGNSSAGLIEAPALGVAVVNVGHRQAGRERSGWVVDVPESDEVALMEGVGYWRARALDRRVGRHLAMPAHPFGDGLAGPRIAALLAKTDPHDPVVLRKRITY